LQLYTVWYVGNKQYFRTARLNIHNKKSNINFLFGIIEELSFG